MNNHQRSPRSPSAKPALSSIGAAVVVMLLASGVQAQQAAATRTSDVDNSPTTYGSTIAPNFQNNAASVTNSADGNSANITTTGTSSGTTYTVNGNGFNAKALGNTAAIAVDMALRSNTLVDGLVNHSLQIDSGNVQSTANSNNVLNDHTGFVGGAVATTNNIISAATTVNSAAEIISGVSGAGVAGSATGSSTLQYDATHLPNLQSTGDILVTTVQKATALDSKTAADGNTVDISLKTAGLPVIASPQVTGNTVDATFKGNSASNTAALLSGGAPAYSGSVTVNNLQVHGNAGGDTITGKADNSGTSIMGTVRSNTTSPATLQGTLSVQNNAVSSAVTGNQAVGAVAGQAGNRIVLDDTLSFAGNGTTGPASTYATYGSAATTAAVSADLLILSSQNNFAAPLTSQTFGGSVLGNVDALAGGGIVVSGNSLTAAANGNVASSSIANGKNAASFTGTAALTNLQGNDGSAVSAATYGATVAATAGLNNGTVNSSIMTVASNLTAATAYGNQATQSVALSATALSNSPQATVLTTTGVTSILATGTATVGNFQRNANSNTTASVAGVTEWLQAGMNAPTSATLTGNTLSVASNTQEAVALGSSATNGLSFQGTTIGSGAGVINAQFNDSNSQVNAGLAGATTALQVFRDVGSSTLSLTGNRERAIAYGTSADNALSVAGTAVVLPAVNGDSAASMVNQGSGSQTVKAAYGLQNNQAIAANATAAADGALSAKVGGKLADSTLDNNANALVAAAYGNNATSMLTLAPGNVATGGFVPVSDATNVQSVTGTGTTVLASVSASPANGRVVGTQIDSNISNSTVSTVGNTVQALAVGNLATTRQTITSTNIDTSTTASRGSVGTTDTTGALATIASDASFSMQNVQAASGAVTATQLSGVGELPVVATSIGITIGVAGTAAGTITGSTVLANANNSLASATANSTTNALVLDANSVATTTALGNVQQSTAAVLAVIGKSVSSPAFNQGGVTISLSGSGTSGSIATSHLSVDNNVTSGAVTGNAATNSLTVAATKIAIGSTAPSSQASITGPAATAQADHALSNVQVSQTGALSSAVYGSFGIDVNTKAAISGSTLSVSGNSQSATSVANTATNAIALGTSGTSSLGAGSALLSVQTGQSAVAALSNLRLFTPVGVDTSSATISKNVNTALGVSNDATNSSTAAATNLAATTVGPMVNQTSATGDHVLANVQMANSTVDSAASTYLSNREANSTTPVVASLTASSVTVSGNTTTAEASANRALNSLSVTGGAAQAASAGLLNSQSSTNSVTATALTTANVTLTPTTAQALNASSVTVNDNSTTALARGNAATNAVVAGAGSTYGVVTGTASTNATAGQTSATTVLSNTQTNGGAVGANSNSTGYQVALNSGTTSANVVNGAVAVSGNTVTAGAYGNSANNSITFNALNGAGGTPTAALANYQVNTGTVTSAVNSAYYGAGITGGATGTAVRVSGNQIASSATGNSVVSTILAAAR